VPAVHLLLLREEGRVVPALVCPPSLGDEPETTFRMARAAALLRPAVLLRPLAEQGMGEPRGVRADGASGPDAAGLPGAGALAAALRAALAIGGALPASRPHGPATTRLLARLAPRVTPEAAAALGEAGRRLVGERGETPGVLSWMAGVDLTAGRMALVLGGQLTAAARVLGAEPADASPLPAKRRLRDLVAFSVSEDYFALRKARAGVVPSPAETLPLSERSSPT
jgi:hypothetical protein